MERSSKNNSSTSQVSKEKISKFRCQMEEFMKFERTCSTSTSSFLEILWILASAHSILTYIILYQWPFSTKFKEALLYFKGASSLTIFLEIIVYMANIIMLVCLFGAKLEYKNYIWYSAIKKIVSLYSFNSRILLFLNAFFLLIDFDRNISAMAITIVISVFETLFIGNYCIRKQENYQSSTPLSLLFKIGVIIKLVSNSLFYRLQQPTALCITNALIGCFWLIWHRKGGYGLFISKNHKLLIRLFIGIEIGIGVTCLSVFSPRVPLGSISSAQLILSIIVVSLYLYSFEHTKSRTIISSQECLTNSFKLKENDLNLQALAEESDYDKNIQNTVVGVLFRAIQDIQCDRCLSHNAQIYQPNLKRTYSPFEIVKEKESLMRYYLKWLYQKTIETNKNKELLLDFVEFGTSSLGDFSCHCQVLAETEILGLNFLQRIRACKLRLILRQQSEAFNRLILGGRIELDEVMTAEEAYEKILKDIGLYCRGSISAWKETLMRQVDISVLQGKMCQNFSLLPQINEGFSSISKFFSSQKYWRMMYFNFALFLKNERIKNRELLDLQQTVSNLDFSDDATPLCTSLTSRSDLPDQIYFHKNSTIIRCIMIEGSLKFDKTSKNFEEITGYSPDQVIGSSLKMILPQDLKVSHDNMVNVWLKSGRSTDQNTFFVRRTHIVNKLSEDMNCLVAFKLYVDLTDPANILKFMSFVNVHHKQQNLKNEQKVLKTTYRTLSRANIFQVGETSKKKKIVDLDPSTNIFLKEEHLQPVSNIAEIQKIKLVMRFLTIALVIFLISLSLNYQRNVSKIGKNVQSLNIVINLLNMPTSIGRLFYNCLIIPAFVRAYTFPMIMEQYQMFNKYSSSPLTQQIIFNSEINPPAQYGPDTVTSINQGITLSSTDVYYTIVSALTTLTHNPLKMSPHDFSILNSYLQPAYETTLNQTKNNLHLELQSSIGSLNSTQLICIVCLSLILITVSVYVCYEVYLYFSKMKEVIEIIIQFNNKEIENIIQYWENVNDHFLRLTKGQINTDDEEELVSLTDQEKEEEWGGPNKASLNQKHKDLVISNQAKTKRYKLCLLMAILIVGFVPTIISIQIVNLVNIADIAYFQTSGFDLFKYFPTTTIAAYGLANQYYSANIPKSQPYNPKRFEETLSTLDLIIEQDYLKDGESSEMFFQKEQNYLFGNPCTYNSQVLINTNSSMVSCLESGSKTLSNGIVSYLRHVHPSLKQYLQGGQKVSSEQLKDISTGLKLVGYYFIDVFQTWYEELTKKVNYFYDQNLFLSVLICLVLVLLHLLVFEWIVLSNLRVDYSFMKNVFRNCVPDYIIAKEKVIKHRFYNSGILEAS